MEVIYDTEKNIVIINGCSKRLGTNREQLLAIPLSTQHQADRIIQVYIDQKESRYVFKNLKSRYSKCGEFVPTREEFNYIFEQLIGS